VLQTILTHLQLCRDSFHAEFSFFSPDTAHIRNALESNEMVHVDWRVADHIC